ncbi:hypothetical protein V7147_22290 [Bacillus sp. JJ1521]
MQTTLLTVQYTAGGLISQGKERGDILIVKSDGEILKYLAIVEG